MSPGGAIASGGGGGDNKMFTVVPRVWWWCLSSLHMCHSQCHRYILSLEKLSADQLVIVLIYLDISSLLGRHEL